MKKLLLSTIAFVGLAVTTAFGQNQLEVLNVPIIDDLNITQHQGPTTRTTTCGPDTVQYPLAKSVGLQSLSINSATSAQAMCQYYDCPQSMSISGLTFYAYKIDATGGTTINVNVQVYLAGPDSMPTGAALVNAPVAVDTTFGGGVLSVIEKHATFTPITMTQPYIVVVQNISPNAVGMITNDYNSGDGQQEWLSSADLFGTWTRGWALVVGGTPFDADFVAMPHVTYDITSDYTMSPACLNTAGTATFTNASSPILSNRMYNQAAYVGAELLSYTWEFGDASPAVNAIDTNHVYTGSGPWNVTLTDTMYGWTTTCVDAVTRSTGSVTDWTSSATNLVVDFTDITTGTPTSWFWDFGDGNTSTQQNPQHTYAAAGTYTVCLTATGICGSDSTCHSVIVTSCALPAVSFTGSNSGTTVVFTDGTTNTPTSWLWDFGDGNTSTQQNPVHVYAADGTYTVCLTATNACGSDSSCSSVTVISCSNPVATWSSTSTDFDASFTDASTNTPTSWLWDFGDGNTSTQQNPTHTYAAEGTYTVCLIATNACGADSSCQSVTITCPAPTSGFTFNVNANGADVDFTSTATGATSYSWDFGDGNTSTQQDPSHTYAAGGNYTACLTVTNNCGTDSMCSTVLAFVGVGENVLDALVEVYPNPTNDQLNITIDNDELEGNISLVNALGQVVDTKAITQGSKAIYTLNVNGLAIGTYYVQVSTNAGVASKKVTVIR